MKKLFPLFLLVLAALAITPAQAAKTSPTEVPGATTVDAAAAKQLFDRGVPFIDVRKNSDWDAGRVPGAHHIELKKRLNADSLGKVVGKDAEVVFYCNGPKCMRSSRAAAKAIEWGYSKVYYFREGYPSWQSSGFPTE